MLKALTLIAAHGPIFLKIPNKEIMNPHCNPFLFSVNSFRAIAIDFSGFFIQVSSTSSYNPNPLSKSVYW